MITLSHAMVLAAGLGTRMRPLTDTLPKPLIPVAGKPLLDHCLDRLEAAGVEKAVVNVHYLADAVEAHVKARPSGLEIAVSDERALLLETGGGLMHAKHLIDADPFLCINSDNIWTDGSAETAEIKAIMAAQTVNHNILSLVQLGTEMTTPLIVQSSGLAKDFEHRLKSHTPQPQ